MSEKLVKEHSIFVGASVTKIDQVILQAIAIAAVLILSGCLDGNSGITSSGTDGHQETHVPVGDPSKGCYLIVGESPVATHCPSITGTAK
jgi:hypothetical protein